MPHPILARSTRPTPPAARALILAAVGFLVAGGLHLVEVFGENDVAASSSLRTADASQAAMAQDVFALEPAAGPREPPASDPGPVEALPGDDAPSDRLLAEIARRQAELDLRQQALDERAREIALDEDELTRLLAALRREREGLEAGLDAAQTASAAEIRRLVAIYEGMKPKEAARILGAMPADAAAAILRPMKEARSAPILARMSADQAFAVTVRLAERGTPLPADRAAPP